MTSKTGFISQESPANALALNKDNSQVVIAGRNVFKIFTLYEDKFEEACNLRVGKNLNLNFSCNDIAWNLIDHHILATAATNGAVVLWNLNKVSRSKQEHVFTDHKRTVNKVSFHMTEPMWLISGSQDGTMKCFDLRIKEAVKTFYSNTESVRDVQFSPHQQHTFAAVSENGHVQQWDLRRPDRYYQYFTAHSGPIFACDWHPEMTWLATASRDKTIKIWDLSIKPKCFYTINTIASVGRIRWRPQRKYHIASCALVVDCSINVWDIRRPFIPFASFNEHKDVPTGVAWRGNPQSFLSTSRDCTLYHHLFQDATRPANKANPQGIALNCNGDVAYACKLNNYYNNNHYNINCNDILTTTTTILTTTTTTMMTTTTATITTSSSSSLSSSSTIIAATLTNEIEGDVENEIETETEAEVSVAASSPTTTTATTSSITIPTTSTMIQTPTAISPSPPSITTILLPPPPPLPTTTTSITATTILPSLSSSTSSSSLLLSTTTLTSSSSTTTLSSSPSSIIITTTTTTTTTTSTSTTTTAAAVITTMAPTLSSSSSSTSLSASTATTTTITKPLKNSTRKIPTSSDQFCMATSIMHRFTLTTKPRGPKWFKICAEEYLLSGRLSDICDKNAKIASSCGRHDVCAIWNIIKTLYESPPKKNNNSNNKSNNGLFKKSTNIKNIELSHDVKKMKQNGINNNNNNVSIIEDDIETDEISENFIFPRLSICRSDYRILLNDHKRDAKGDFFFGESELDPMTTIDYNNDTTNNDDTNNSNNNNNNNNNSNNNSSNNNNNNDDSINNNANAINNNNSSNNNSSSNDNTTTTTATTTTNNSNDNDNCGLNREAFPLRHEIQDRSPPPEQYPNNSPEIIDGSVSAIDDQPCQLVLTNIPKPLFWDPTEVVKEALKHHAAIRDVQTSATILIALGNKRDNLNFEIAIQEHWLLEYIDMLARFKLYNVITQIIQLAWIPSVSQLNQQSTMIHVCCTSCTKPLQRSAWICDRCHTSKHALCSICHQVVKGVYAWCQGCTHGGHVLHMKEWFINNRCCPTGCGHICEYT